MENSVTAGGNGAVGPGLSETGTPRTRGWYPRAPGAPGPVPTEAQQLGRRAAQPQLAGQGREAAARRAVADLGQHLGHGVQVLRDVLRAAPSHRCPRVPGVPAVPVSPPPRVPVPSCPGVPVPPCPGVPVSRCPRPTCPGVPVSVSPVPCRYLQRGRAQERAGIGHHVRHARHVRAPHGPARPGCRSRRGDRWERQHRASASGRRGQVTSGCHMTARAGAGSGSGAAAGNAGGGRGSARPGPYRRSRPGAARPRALPAPERYRPGGVRPGGRAARFPGPGRRQRKPRGRGDGEASVPEGVRGEPVRGRPGPLRAQGLGNGGSGTGEWRGRAGERHRAPGSERGGVNGAGEVKASGGETVQNRKKRKWAKSPEVRDGTAGRGSALPERGEPAARPGLLLPRSRERHLWTGQRSGIDSPGSRSVAVVAAGEEQKLQP